MSNVEIAFGENPAETAVLLLAAAEETGAGPAAVRTTSFRSFMVPEEVAKKAGLSSEGEASTASESTDTEEKPAKKKPAKRSGKKSAKKE